MRTLRGASLTNVIERRRWLLRPRVVILRPEEDLGPLTKLLPVVEREPDPETLILTGETGCGKTTQILGEVIVFIIAACGLENLQQL